MYGAVIGAGLSAMGGSGGLTGGSSNPKQMTSHSDVTGNNWKFGDFIYKGSGGTTQESYKGEIMMLAAAAVAVVAIIAFSKK